MIQSIVGYQLNIVSEFTSTGRIHGTI